MMKDYKVVKEVAENEFFRFLEKMDIEVDFDEMSDDDTKDFSTCKNKLVKAIMQGSLIINDEGLPVYTPTRSDNKDPITFNEASGSTILQTDKSKSNQTIHKIYASMAELTKTTPSLFSKMKMKDLNICMSICTLFLAQ